MLGRIVSMLLTPLSEHPNKLLASIYLLKVSKRNTRIKCEILSKLTIKTPKQRQWRRFGIFIVNFEQVITGWVDKVLANKTKGTISIY